MTFTLSIPTWSHIKDMFLLIVLYYSTLVAPQYDWYIFGITYFLGILTLARSVYREDFNCHPIDVNILYFLCILWPIYTPIKMLIAFIVFFVTFANPKKVFIPVDWEGKVIYCGTAYKIRFETNTGIRKESECDPALWRNIGAGDTIFGQTTKSGNYEIHGKR